MPVVPGFGKPVEHLEADEVQILQPVAFAVRLACHGVLCDVVDEPVAVGVVFYMLDLHHDTLEVLTFYDHVRDDLFA